MSGNLLKKNVYSELVGTPWSNGYGIHLLQSTKINETVNASENNLSKTNHMIT
jgi:hypothetical protein